MEIATKICIAADFGSVRFYFALYLALIDRYRMLQSTHSLFISIERLEFNLLQ